LRSELWSRSLSRESSRIWFASSIRSTFFDYVTDGDGVVLSAQAINARPEAARGGAVRIKAKAEKKQPPRPDAIAVHDRVRIDRIKPYDRKPGPIGVGSRGSSRVAARARNSTCRFQPKCSRGESDPLRRRGDGQSGLHRVGFG
jgi:hypothetical protein